MVPSEVTAAVEGLWQLMQKYAGHMQAMKDASAAVADAQNLVEKSKAAVADVVSAIADNHSALIGLIEKHLPAELIP